MVRTVQAYRPAARRNRSGKGRRSEGCESKRGRKSESFFQVQHPRHSIAAVFQERTASGSGHRNDEQERSAQPAGSACLTIFSDIRRAPEREVLASTAAYGLRTATSPNEGPGRR